MAINLELPGISQFEEICTDVAHSDLSKQNTDEEKDMSKEKKGEKNEQKDEQKNEQKDEEKGYKSSQDTGEL